LKNLELRKTIPVDSRDLRTGNNSDVYASLVDSQPNIRLRSSQRRAIPGFASSRRASQRVWIQSFSSLLLKVDLKIA